MTLLNVAEHLLNDYMLDEPDSMAHEIHTSDAMTSDVMTEHYRDVGDAGHGIGASTSGTVGRSGDLMTDRYREVGDADGHQPIGDEPGSGRHPGRVLHDAGRSLAVLALGALPGHRWLVYVSIRRDQLKVWHLFLSYSVTSQS